MAGELMEDEIIGIEFYEIVNSRNKSQNIVKVETKSKTNNQTFINLQVIGSMDEEEKNHLTIYCDNEEFSSLEHGKEVLSKVADYVISKRENKAAYPIYITDIDFSKNILDVIEPKNLQTIHFLKYKKKIEERLQLVLDKR